MGGGGGGGIINLYDIAENTHERADDALLLINSNLPPPPESPISHPNARPPGESRPPIGWATRPPSLAERGTDEGDVASHRETEKCVPRPKGRRRETTCHTVFSGCLESFELKLSC